MTQGVHTAKKINKNWSDIIDIVQNRPIKVSRNNKNTFSLIPLYMWELLLADYSLELTIEEDEGEGYIASFEGIDLIAAEGTKEDTIEPGTETLSITADPRSDGLVKARTGDTTDETTYKEWYKTVYTPTEEGGGMA